MLLILYILTLNHRFQKIYIFFKLLNSHLCDLILCYPQTTASILELLKSINEQFQITIVIITHQMSVIREICNRVAIIEHGELVENGLKEHEIMAKKQISKSGAAKLREELDFLVTVRRAEMAQKLKDSCCKVSNCEVLR